MNSKYGRTLSFSLSKSLFFDEKCHFCSRASCGLLFMNSGNSKTPDPHRLLLNISDKINLKRSTK